MKFGLIDSFDHPEQHVIVIGPDRIDIRPFERRVQIGQAIGRGAGQPKRL